MPIFRAMVTISSLSIPTSGMKIGMSTTAPVTVIASIVWEATWPRFSPVTRAPQPSSLARRWAISIMNRRIMRVKYSSGQLSRMASWISVKETMFTVILPLYRVTSLASSRTLSLAN